MKDRTRAYWPTRILLAIGVVATALCAFAAWDGYLLDHTIGPGDMAGGGAVLGVPLPVVIAIVATAFAVLGLIWMIRIFRGPRDEPPVWRYRDR